MEWQSLNPRDLQNDSRIALCQGVLLLAFGPHALLVPFPPPWLPRLIPADSGSCMNGPPDVGPSVLRPDTLVFAFLSGDDLLSLGRTPLEAADFQIHISGWTQVFPLDMAPGQAWSLTDVQWRSWHPPRLPLSVACFPISTEGSSVHPRVHGRTPFSFCSSPLIICPHS